MSPSSWLLGGLLVFGMADVVAIDLVIGPRALSPPGAVLPRIVSAHAPVRTVPESATESGVVVAAAGADVLPTAPAAGAAPPSSPDRAPAPPEAEPPKEPGPLPADSSGTAPAEQPSAPGTGAVVDRPIVIIYFTSDHDLLDEDATNTLDVLASELSNTAELVDIVGHADARGSEHHNEGLSARRMQRVRDYLAAHGIDSDRLRGRAAGDREPAREGTDEVSLAANRRVEIRRTP